MTEQELIEQLADKEHASWARWMEYLFGLCTHNAYGEAVIPADCVERWQRQIDTPYADLSEREKQSDREEVAHILPIIQRYAGEIANSAVLYEIQQRERKTAQDSARQRRTRYGLHGSNGAVGS